MSCDGNRDSYFVAVSGGGSAAAQAFGGAEAAKQALDDLFAIGRNGPKPPFEARLAEAQTRLMFAQMQRQRIKPPTHSTSGLPRADAQFGYALVQRTLTALERGEALPPQARELFLARERERQITSLRTDVRGRVRCGGCGQYTSPIRGHVCKTTASVEALRRSLVRRLGVPPSSYPDEQLAALLEAARAGDVTMRHPTMGEVVSVTLDGLPLALGSGFVPELWAGAGRRIVTPGGAVLTVLDGTGLREVPEMAPLQVQLIAKRDEVQARLRMTLDEQERARLFHYWRDLHDAIRDNAAVAAAASDFGLQLTPEMPIIGVPALSTPVPNSSPVAPAVETFAYGSDPTRAYRMRYRVVDLDDLVPSNLDSGAINPAYDAALQPRQRDRAASQAQIARVAQTLTPDALLTDFKQLDKGAPILGPEDRCVELGNGRILALRKAREAFPAQWEAYQGRLQAVAASFGIDAAELAQMRSPVLVRERVDAVDRAAFAREANAPPVLQMSTLENAVIDAKRLTDDTLLRLNVREDQSIDLALRARGNAAFVRDFMQTLPDNERATLMRADGTLNQQGIWRIKAALFTRTFPGNSGRRLAETFTEALELDDQEL